MRIPQSKQSAPSSHTPYSEPSPPSSHSPSLPYAVQLLVHRPSTSRGPQSMQSLPSGHAEYSAPSPPSSQSPSLLNPRVAQSSWHAVKFSAAESTAERSSAARMSEVAKCSRGAWGYGETQRVVPRVGAIRYFVLVLYRIAYRHIRTYRHRYRIPGPHATGTYSCTSYPPLTDITQQRVWSLVS